MEHLQEYELIEVVKNMMVARWMLDHSLTSNQNCVIAGRSVHNQRIEHLWKDLYSGCVSFFYSFFYYLDEVNILEKDDIRVHLVFLPVIQEQLDLFKEGWAHHSLHTINSRTPM